MNRHVELAGTGQRCFGRMERPRHGNVQRRGAAAARRRETPADGRPLLLDHQLCSSPSQSQATSSWNSLNFFLSFSFFVR